MGWGWGAGLQRRSRVGRRERERERERELSSIPQLLQPCDNRTGPTKPYRTVPFRTLGQSEAKPPTFLPCYLPARLRACSEPALPLVDPVVYRFQP